jgi:hypothetical protein
MPADPKDVAKDINRDPAKDQEQLNKVNAPQGEHATTRDTTPTVEKPGEEPTQPDRPQP